MSLRNFKVNTFSTEYVKEMQNVLEKLNKNELTKLVEILWDVYINNRSIFFAGNGGSASTASHLAADIGKNTVLEHKNISEKRARTISLCDSIPWITALANDLSFDYVFLEQLKNVALKGDCLFIISGSGNSLNIVKAARWAKANKLRVVGLLGFNGGKVHKYLEHAIVVDSYNYGIVESAHSFIHHFIVSALEKRKRAN